MKAIRQPSAVEKPIYLALVSSFTTGPPLQIKKFGWIQQQFVTPARLGDRGMPGHSLGTLSQTESDCWKTETEIGTPARVEAEAWKFARQRSSRALGTRGLYVLWNYYAANSHAATSTPALGLEFPGCHFRSQKVDIKHWMAWQFTLNAPLVHCLLSVVQWLVQHFRTERLWGLIPTVSNFAHVRRQSLPVWPPTLIQIPLPLNFVDLLLLAFPSRSTRGDGRSPQRVSSCKSTYLCWGRSKRSCATRSMDAFLWRRWLSKRETSNGENTIHKPGKNSLPKWKKNANNNHGMMLCEDWLLVFYFKEWKRKRTLKIEYLKWNFQWRVKAF